MIIDWSAIRITWIGLLFDTAPYIVLWLLLEVWLHSRAIAGLALPIRRRVLLSARYTFGPLWDKSWYWQLIGITALAVITPWLPEQVKSWADLSYTASYQPDMLAIMSLAIVVVLTLARLLKKAFPTEGAGCGNGGCSIDRRE